MIDKKLNPHTKTIFLYPLCSLLAVGFYFLVNVEYHHPDSSYLRARYAQNLIQGDGFVYNPHERILLTSAPLMILAEAVTTLPQGEIAHPPELLPLMMIGIVLAALIRILRQIDIALGVAIGAAVICLIPMWLTFGGVELWLAALSLVTLDLAQNHHWLLAGVTAGFLLLIAPLGMIFVVLLGIHAQRQYGYLVWIPAVLWWGFAVWYFGEAGLRGMVLASAPGEGFQGVFSFVILVPLVFWILFSLPNMPPLLLVWVIWGLSYSLLAMAFKLTSDATLLVAACVLMATKTESTRILQAANVGMLVVLGIVVGIQQNPVSESPAYHLVGSKGHLGDNREAFQLGGVVYQLNGERDPQLRELVDDDDSVGVILAAAPDFLLLDTLPHDPILDLLGYQLNNGIWKRSAVIYPWQKPQVTDITFGTDIHLKQVTLDRHVTQPGGILRLRLDWELLHNKQPTDRLLFLFNALNFQQASFGSMEQIFPAPKWETLQTATYHIIPFNADAPPGRYNIQLAIDVDGGIVDRQIVASVKIPPQSELVFTEPPIAVFGNQQADLMQAQLTQMDDRIQVSLTWRAGNRFDADYSIFVHLTPADDINPITQADAPPMGGRYPTSLWEADEIIEDIHLLDVSDIPPGDYVIKVGFFHPERGRIPTANGDSVMVGSITLD